VEVFALTIQHMSSLLILNDNKRKTVYKKTPKCSQATSVALNIHRHAKQRVKNNSVSEAMYLTELPSSKQSKVTTFSFQFKFALQIAERELKLTLMFLIN
jgi:hypothetical protein